MRFLLKGANCDGQIGGIRQDARLQMVGLYRRDDEQGLPQRVLYQGRRKKDVKLLYVTDHISGCCYVDVSGRDSELLLNVMAKQPNLWTNEELVDSWKAAEGEEEKMLAVLRLGVASSGEFAEQWDTHIRQALLDESEPVRFAAVTAIGYCEWESLDGVLWDLAEKDESERMRKRAALTLELRQEQRK